MKRRTKGTILIVIAGVLVLSWAAWTVWDYTGYKTALRNSSGEEITNVSFSVLDMSGNEIQTRNTARLASTQSLVLLHRMRDSRARVSFILRGKECRHTEGYVDLWMGEGWVMDVQPDGSIQSGYQSTVGK